MVLDVVKDRELIAKHSPNLLKEYDLAKKTRLGRRTYDKLEKSEKHDAYIASSELEGDAVGRTEYKAPVDADGTFSENPNPILANEFKVFEDVQVKNEDAKTNSLIVVHNSIIDFDEKTAVKTIIHEGFNHIIKALKGIPLLLQHNDATEDKIKKQVDKVYDQNQ